MKTAIEMAFIKQALTHGIFTLEFPSATSAEELETVKRDALRFLNECIKNRREHPYPSLFQADPAP